MTPLCDVSRIMKNTESARSKSDASTPETTKASPNWWQRLSVKARILIAVLVAAVVIAAIVTPISIARAKARITDPTQTALGKKIAKIYTEDYQNSVADSIDAKKAAKDYTVDDMLALENPYGTNTTSLYVYFTTDAPVSVSYTVTAPDTDYPDFTATAYQASEFQVEHEFSVLGLIPDTTNTIIFTLTDETGESTTQTLDYRLGDLLGSEEVQVETTASDGTTDLGNGLYAILGNDSDDQDFMFYYDDSGVLRGEIPILYYRAHRLLFRDDLMYFSTSTHDIVGMNRLGRVVRWYNTTDKYLLHHDYALDEDGNLVVLATDTTADTIQDAIIQIDGKTGKVTQLLDMADILGSYEASTETASMGSPTTSSATSGTIDTNSPTFNADSSQTKKDWMHLNSIQLLDNGSAIVSSRETSTIIKINDLVGAGKDGATTPSLDYMIGQESFWKDSDFTDYLLDKDTSDGDWPATGGQHSVTYVEDDSLADGQYYLEIFDNNYGLSRTRSDFNWAANVEGISTKMNSGETSHYYKYLVDEAAGTYKLVQSYDVPYSSIVSSVQPYDADGTTIIDSGKQGLWGVYADDGTLVRQYKMKIMSSMIYRVYKYDFVGFYFN